MPTVMALGSGVFGKFMKMGAQIKEAPESCLDLSTSWGHGEKALFMSQKAGSQQTLNLLGTLIFDSSASKTVRNQFL
jgi:hypothetical protein